ncbi:MAG: polyprenyl synthetase family protein [Rhizobiaceae bacterium]|nr:polyprenyl synthetase family protein [Rhizobiaceae bacterium]
MEASARIEICLEKAIEAASSKPCPPLLAKAVHYSVFPGGARVRPQLCVSVATACGGTESVTAEHAGAAIELLHCASLVHDDLPCFDDADIRRGRKSVHALYGEPLAVLVGDALIVESFNTLRRGCENDQSKLGPLVSCIAGAVGMPGGIVAGQAWESESKIDVHQYHRAKTGSLFVGAVAAGAIAVGEDPQPWCPLGQFVGEAYQLADDLFDAAGSSDENGKPVLQDVNNDRPNAVARYGIDGTMKRLKETVGNAVDAIPDCEGGEELRSLILAQATRLVPSKLAKSAA